VRAFDVDRHLARWTAHASATDLLAHLANLVISRLGNQGYSLARSQGLGVTKLDLRGPGGACDVDPVVVCRSFKRFTRVDWAMRV